MSLYLSCLVQFSGHHIKKIIMEQSVRLNLFYLVVAGLPFSGKSSLVNSLFGAPHSGKTSDYDLHETIIRRNKLSGESHWMDGSKLDSVGHTILNAFAHFFIKERQLPNWTSDNSDLKIFDDPEIQGYFETTYKSLCQLLDNDDASQVENILSSSLTLMNVYDFGMNKGMYEFMMAVHGRNRKMLLLDVVDIKKYPTKGKLIRPLNLKDSPYTEEHEISIYEGRSAMHHLLLPMEAAALSSSIIAKAESIPQSQAPSNTLLVGTHADELEKPNECKSTVLEAIKSYCRDMGYQSVCNIPCNVIPVNATDVNDCEKIRKSLLKLIDANKSFSIDLPIKFIFLHYVLYCTKKVFMSRKKVSDFARKCGIDGDEEINQFLLIFRDCASIISSDQPEDFLYDYFILLPANFLHDLNKLYCVESNKSLLPEHKTAARYGIVDKVVVRSLWQGSDDNSMPTYEFYVRALETVGLLMELPRGKFFVPSLRSIHNGSDVNHKKYVSIRYDSLIIRCCSDVTLTPFSSKQCYFVKYLLERSKDFTLVEECDCYNIIEFLWKSKARVSIRFFHDFIEVHVDRSNISPSNAALLYSILKTDCIAILNEIGSISRMPFDYQFCFVCPNSDLKPIDSHAVPFDILYSSSEEFECEECEQKFHSREVEGIHWVRAAYQGPQRAAIRSAGEQHYCVCTLRPLSLLSNHPLISDVLDPLNLVTIIKDHLSSLEIQDIHKLAEHLNTSLLSSHVPVQEVLFNVLYTWHSKNLSATKKDLAALLHECGLYKEAFTLDPKCELLSCLPLLSS